MKEQDQAAIWELLAGLREPVANLTPSRLEVYTAGMIRGTQREIGMKEWNRIQRVAKRAAKGKCK